MVGKKTFILMVLGLMTITFYSQVVTGHLVSAGSCFYKHRVYAFGYEQRKDLLIFKCFSYSGSLQLKDSVELSLGKHTPQHFLEISVDTLHNVLNFYFQKADQKNKVTLLRMDSTLKRICVVSDYDANHINSLTAFDDETYRFGKDLYLIKTVPDTSGLQFYLSKYAVKAMDAPFEYDFKWQYAFDRHHIHRASVIYADSVDVILYVNVAEGIKKGQWILRINATTGILKKGTKLNPKADNRHFLYSNAIYNKTLKSIDVVGSIYPAGMIDFKTQSSNFKNLSALHRLFLIRIDSLGDVSFRMEKPFAIPAISKSGTAALSLHVKVREFTKQDESSYTVSADVYEQGPVNVMTYYGSWNLKLLVKEDGFTIKAPPFYAPGKSIPGLTGSAKGTVQGKIYLKNAGDYDQFKYLKAPDPILIKTGTDANDNPFYVLKKTTMPGSRKTFYYVSSGKKGPENKVILSAEKGQFASVYFIGNNAYISLIANDNATFKLELIHIIGRLSR